MKNERLRYFEKLFEDYRSICEVIPEGERNETVYQRAAKGVLTNAGAEYTLSEIEQLNLNHLSEDPVLLKSFINQATSFILNDALL